jgi:hypothetical protein
MLLKSSTAVKISSAIAICVEQDPVSNMRE